MVLSLGLESLFRQGARQALPGEFTKRAFLHGRLDLTQAEAVADLVDAETPARRAAGCGQLSGVLGRRVRAVYDGLVDVLAHFHAVLDYPDEEIDPFRSETIGGALDRAREALEGLLATYDRGRYICGGVPCVLAGRPNAGEILSAQRAGGLRAGHRHRRARHHPGYGGGALPSGRRGAPAHRYGGTAGDGGYGGAAGRGAQPLRPGRCGAGAAGAGRLRPPDRGG